MDDTFAEPGQYWNSDDEKSSPFKSIDNTASYDPEMVYTARKLIPPVPDDSSLFDVDSAQALHQQYQQSEDVESKSSSIAPKKIRKKKRRVLRQDDTTDVQRRKRRDKKKSKVHTKRFAPTVIGAGESC